MLTAHEFAVLVDAIALKLRFKSRHSPSPYRDCLRLRRHHLRPLFGLFAFPRSLFIEPFILRANPIQHVCDVHVDHILIAGNKAIKRRDLCHMMRDLAAGAGLAIRASI